MQGARTCPQCGHAIRGLSLVCEQCGATAEAHPQQLSPVLAGPARPAGPVRMKAAFDRRGFRSLMFGDESGLSSLHRSVAACDHVRTNPKYARAAQTCWSHLCWQVDDPIHAFAAPATHESQTFRCEQCGESPAASAESVMVLSSGMVVFAGLLASLVAAPLLIDRSGQRIAVAKHRLAECVTSMRPPDFVGGTAAKSLFERAVQATSDPGVLPLARDIARGIVLAVFAHELGHIAYGHVRGVRSLLEIERNTERDADSFAASVLATLPNPDRSLLGSIIFWSCVSRRARQLGGETETTHPFSEARIDAMITSMPSAMEVLGSVHGLTRQDLVQFAR